jgi:fatty-acyl-CoA synthase
VIGVPDPKWVRQEGIVVRRPADTSAEQLMAWVKERKGAVYAPKSVDFADSPPVTVLGKPDKKALRARYWAGHERQVS